MITALTIGLIVVYLWATVAAFTWEADYRGSGWPVGWKDWCGTVLGSLIWPLYPALRILNVIKR